MHINMTNTRKYHYLHSNIKKGIFILLAFLITNSCTNSSDYVYRDEELLMKYLQLYHSEVFQEEEYLLFTFRTQRLCRTCRAEPLETTLKRAVEDRGDLKMYVLTDKQEDMQYVQSMYGHVVHCLFGDDKMMNKYGIPHLEPVLFHIKDKKVLDVSDYFSH